MIPFAHKTHLYRIFFKYQVMIGSRKAKKHAVHNKRVSYLHIALL